jgi:molybdate transport system substrate-binding protein
VRRVWILAVLTSVVAAACSSSGSSPSLAATTLPPATSAEPVELTVFAAASLRDALDAVKLEYEAATPGTTLTISTDSSAALETQIEQGAPADVFLSADTTNPQKLVEGGFASGDAVAFAGNELTIIVPTDNPGDVASPMDLAKSRLKVVAAGDEVPITKYATQLVTNLAALDGAPAGFAAAYGANVVSKEDNVRSIVAKIELGEGDAGIVYVTDASASSAIETVVVPDDVNVPATYAGVVVKASSKQDAAAAFLGWLAGDGGRAVLSDFGFLPPPS